MSSLLFTSLLFFGFLLAFVILFRKYAGDFNLFSGASWTNFNQNVPNNSQFAGVVIILLSLTLVMTTVLWITADAFIRNAGVLLALVLIFLAGVYRQEIGGLYQRAKGFVSPLFGRGFRKFLLLTCVFTIFVIFLALRFVSLTSLATTVANVDTATTQAVQAVTQDPALELVQPPKPSLLVRLGQKYWFVIAFWILVASILFFGIRWLARWVQRMPMPSYKQGQGTAAQPQTLTGGPPQAPVQNPPTQQQQQAAAQRTTVAVAGTRAGTFTVGYVARLLGIIASAIVVAWIITSTEFKMPNTAVDVANAPSWQQWAVEQGIKEWQVRLAGVFIVSALVLVIIGLWKKPARTLVCIMLATACIILWQFAVPPGLDLHKKWAIAGIAGLIILLIGIVDGGAQSRTNVVWKDLVKLVRIAVVIAVGAWVFTVVSAGIKAAKVPTESPITNPVLILAPSGAYSEEVWISGPTDFKFETVPEGREAFYILNHDASKRYKVGVPKNDFPDDLSCVQFTSGEPGRTVPIEVTFGPYGSMTGKKK
jgi:hypothetical protein